MPSGASYDFSKGVNSVLGINNINSLLADDDDDDVVPGQSLNALVDSVKHLHMETNGEGFPLLRRRDTDVAQDDRQANGMSTIHRHRAGQQSLPWNTLRSSQHEDMEDNIFTSPGRKTNTNNRRSMDVYSAAMGTQSKRSSMHSMTNGYGGGVPKLQQSYSTNDIPTVKNVTNMQDPHASTGANMTHAEQHLHNHNASMGRVPPSASNRQSRDYSALEPRVDDTATFPNVSSALQANAPTFQSPPSHMTSPNGSTLGANTYGATNGFYNSYNMPMVNGSMNGSAYGGNQNGWGGNGYGAHYQNYNGFNGYSRPHFQPPDSQRAVMKSRKGDDGKHSRFFRNGKLVTDKAPDGARFAQYNLETLTGQIYDLCKDQHGCRYLQRKIEEGNEIHIAMIFEETKGYIVELMTGKCLLI